jgi:hypothetical protein
MDPVVTESLKRFEELAREDCDVIAMEGRLFTLVDDVRRAAGGRKELLEEIAARLESVAHRMEGLPFGEPDMLDQGAPLRCAGALRRAADLLRGPEKDLTPKGVSGEGPTRGR